uniref:NADH dehydrogenase subunit 4L n=1 Tax=Cordax unidentatus TaxID=3021430 RepID=UPI0030FE7746|nr:NADH dehydrogenase subunit 4L [Cordax unidentatus]
MFTQIFSVGMAGSCGVMLTLVGISMVASKRKHLLATLLSLEFTVLGLFLLVGWSLTLLFNNFIFGLIFLTLSVCEGSLGLTILVAMVRAHGNDYFSSINVL